MTDRIPILLDTDIGSDIDDAVCLAYLLKQPRCDLLGITTVSGTDPRLRASLADAVCQAAGRKDVPIYSGTPTRLDTGVVVQQSVPQAVVLDRFPHRSPDSFARYEAVEFLRETINRRPGEITLLAIGPMSNLNLLFSLDPDIPRKLKALVLMCGVFKMRMPNVGQAEWNAWCDPLATRVVYRAPAAVHRSIGLDVTLQVVLPGPEAVRRFRAAGGALNVVAACTEIWNDVRPEVVFHDPLAATTIFKPDMCTWQRGHVTVEYGSERLGGYTSFERKADGPHEVALGVDPKAFFDEYFGIVGS